MLTCSVYKQGSCQVIKAPWILEDSAGRTAWEDRAVARGWAVQVGWLGLSLWSASLGQLKARAV